MLSYDWLKIVGAAAALILVWTLVFTMTATRITSAQQFTIVNYYGNLSINSTKMSDTLSDCMREGVFSYEVIETTTVDVPGSGDYGGQVLEARFATSEGDVIFVPNVENKEASYELNGETLYESYIQTLVRSYGYALCNLDPEAENGYFKKMEKFLNTYYNGGWENGELNEELVEQDFRARITRNKDKRFKKQAEIEQGIQDEIARIAKYRDGLKEFYGYLNSSLIELTKTAVYDHQDQETLLREGVFSINLCPNKDTMGKLKEYTAYSATYIDEAGEEKSIITAENMNVAFITFADVEPSFEYENLLYINYLIRQVKTA